MLTFWKSIALTGLVLTVAACDVNKTEDGEMPEVHADSGNLPEYEVKKTEEGRMPDIDVEGGKLPEYDVDTADVDIVTKKKVIEVPEVEVTMPDEKNEGEVDPEDRN